MKKKQILRVEGLLQFPALSQPRINQAYPNQPPAYGARILIPKSDTKTVSAIRNAVESVAKANKADVAMECAYVSKKKFIDGDVGRAGEFDYNHGSYILDVKSTQKPAMAVLLDGVAVRSNGEHFSTGDTVVCEVACVYLKQHRKMFFALNAVFQKKQSEFMVEDSNAIKEKALNNIVAEAGFGAKFSDESTKAKQVIVSMRSAPRKRKKVEKNAPGNPIAPPNQGQGQWPTQAAPNQGQGQWPTQAAPNQGQGQWPTQAAQNQGQGQWPTQAAQNQGQGQWPTQAAQNQDQGQWPTQAAPNQGQGQWSPNRGAKMPSTPAEDSTGFSAPDPLTGPEDGTKTPDPAGMQEGNQPERLF